MFCVFPKALRENQLESPGSGHASSCSRTLHSFQLSEPLRKRFSAAYARLADETPTQPGHSTEDAFHLAADLRRGFVASRRFIVCLPGPELSIAV